MLAMACVAALCGWRAQPAAGQLATVGPSDGLPGDGFGQSVALGTDWLAVGMPQPDGLKKDVGAVYVFRPGGQGWVQETKLQADNATSAIGFGISVAMAGSTLVVGAWNDGPGSAYVYQWNGVAWQKQAKLQAAGLSDGANFGCSVAISGQTIVVGAYSSSQSGTSSGSAYVFDLSGGVWTQSALLLASDSLGGDYFGRSVSIEGGRLAVGAYGRDDAGRDSGACYIFDHGAQGWTQTSKVEAPDAATRDQFGRNVALCGGRLAVAAPGDAPAGSVYVFAPGPAGWSQQSKLSAPAGAVAADGFGSSLAFDGRDLVVGASGASGGAGSGAAYLFSAQGASWSSPVKLAAQVVSAGTKLGDSLAVSDGCIVAGAPGTGASGSLPGSACTFADGLRTVWRTGTTNPLGPARWDDPGQWTAGMPSRTTDTTIESGPAAEVAAGVSGFAGTLQVGLTAPGRLEVRGGGKLDVAALHVAANGSLTADAGATIRLRGSLDVRATDPAAFDVAAATVCFAPADTPVPPGSAAGPDLLEAASRDEGLAAAGWLDNFAIGTLAVEAGATLRLVDAIDNDPAGAGSQTVYVDTLVLSPGATLDLNGLTLYYRNGGPPRRLIRGDTNLDGKVDIVDMLALEADFGCKASPGWAGGDSDGDGDVDMLDYLTMKDAFAETGPQAGASPGPTPEPASAALLAVAAAAALSRRPSRRRRDGTSQHSRRRPAGFERSDE